MHLISRYISAITILCVTLPCLSQSSDTLTYSLVSAGIIKGHEKIWQHPDGTFEDQYQFNDRGRGDSIRMTYRQDEKGFPTFMQVTGVDYMKNPVFENFSLDQGIAKWENQAEKDQKTITGKAFYMGLVFTGGSLYKALRANNNKLRLLPFGTVEMKELTPYAIKHADKTITLQLIELTGNGYTPSYAWIDEDDQFFAYVNDWMSEIRSGYEFFIDDLLEIQNSFQLTYFTDLAKSIPQPIEDGILIRNVNVFDAKSGTIQPERDIIIMNGIITAILPGNIMAPSGDRIIDGTGMTILPGLWDMHTHTSEAMEGILHLACGVTHIRDMGNSEALLVKRKQFADGALIGPRIEVISGLIDRAGPLAAPTGVLIDNVDQGLQMVRDLAAKGYDQIKLYSSIKPEWVKPMADEAHKNHMRVCGHIPAFMTATTAIEYGYDEITHMNMLALNFFGDTIDTRSTLRFVIPGERTAGLNLQSVQLQSFIQLLKTKNIAVDPTLNIFEFGFLSRDNVISPVYAWAIDHFPLKAQRSFRAGGGGFPVKAGMDETYKKSFEAFLKLTKMLYDNNIRILPGTDDFPGFALLRELELYVKAGIPAGKVLQMATWDCAVYTGKSAEYGSIEEGRKADFILVDGDPTTDITKLHNTKLVITNGKVYEPNKLFGAVSISPF